MFYRFKILYTVKNTENDYSPTALQKQTVASAYFASKQILPSTFAKQYGRQQPKDHDQSH